MIGAAGSRYANKHLSFPPSELFFGEAGGTEAVITLMLADHKSHKQNPIRHVEKNSEGGGGCGGWRQLMEWVGPTPVATDRGS